MNLTLLIDLDDTLLANDIEIFLPKYLEAFSRKIHGFIEVDTFVQALLAGTKAMVQNRMPDCTLKETFEQTFYSIVNVDRALFETQADDFYARVFPTLKILTNPIPGAVDLVNQSFDMDFRIGIATNPLFPMTAIEQRLSWAGLPVDRYPFQIISSYESFHFSKSEPAYFAEILGRMGWPEGPAVMVGDNLKNDIYPAEQLDIPTFWVNTSYENSHDDPDSSTMMGSLDQVLPWLVNIASDSLAPSFKSSSAKMAILRSTPAVLDSLCRELPLSSWKHRPSPGEWGVAEIVCHLRDVDKDVNIPRIRKLLDELNPFLPGKDTDSWAVERLYDKQDGLEALQRFISLRIKLLDILEALDVQDWQRQARHAILGPTNLAELVSIITEHDRLHIRQVRNLLMSLS